jgi:hypothetical protein
VPKPEGRSVKKNSGNLEFDFGGEIAIRPSVRSTPVRRASHLTLEDELAAFREFGKPTQIQTTACAASDGARREVPTYINEFWTANQRAANNLHEVSYRACFKPQLPRFFIERLTHPGDRVYDPFMGRGTTLIEAALLGREPLGCDVNPLSAALTRPRLCPPAQSDVARRLAEIDFSKAKEWREDLLVFYHPDTLREIIALKEYLLGRKARKALDSVDRWIAMVALNRLTGHSAGFFSVYTLPPNQAVSIKSQIRINTRRNQTPPRRIVPAIILKKSRQLMGDLDDEKRETLSHASRQSMLLTQPCAATPEIPAGSVNLVVTSPPFLDVVDYAGDNWLRCWFMGIDLEGVHLTVPKKLEVWREAMTAVFFELARVLHSKGHVAFEVGEVHAGNTRLEDAVLQCGVAAGLRPRLVMINSQIFTKTANCWGVDNNSRGTNTNRIVLFSK